MESALQFLREHRDVALATSEDNIPKLRIFQIMKQEGNDHNAVLSRLYPSYDRMVYFCLPIAEMDYYDLTPTPPVFKHFDLMVGEVSNGFVGEKAAWIQDV